MSRTLRPLAHATGDPYLDGMFIETETTPNPASLKFLPGRTVMPSGTREFASPGAAEASPLAQATFDTGQVVNVFYGWDFVTVTAAPGVDWSGLKPKPDWRKMATRTCFFDPSR